MPIDEMFAMRLTDGTLKSMGTPANSIEKCRKLFLKVENITSKLKFC